MIKTLKVAVAQEALTLITGMTYARVPSWYGFTREDLKMDLILPKHTDGHAPMPAVLWLCGGAFCVVDRSVWMPQMVDLARRGYVVASVNYRTSNAVPFPAQLMDVKAAIRFLRANAAEFCIDPNRVAVMGESAGGTLASLAGVTADMPEFDVGEHLETSSAVQAVVDFYGLSQLVGKPEHSDDPNVADWALTAFLGGLTPEKAARASAVNYVDENTPPFMILHGTEDITVPMASSELLYEKLTEKGVYVEFYKLEGAAHGDDMFYQEPVFDLIDAFLNDCRRRPAEAADPRNRSLCSPVR